MDDDLYPEASYEWLAYYPKDISGVEGRIYSTEEFTFHNGFTKASFAIYIDKDAGFEDYVVGVEMKTNPEGKRLKLDVQVWLENHEGVSSKKYEKKNCTFFKVGDTWGFELGGGTASTIFSRAMQDDACLSFCCKLTDKTSAKTKPTLDWYKGYHQRLWEAYKQGIGLDTTIKLDSGKEFKVMRGLLIAQSPVFQTMFKEIYVEGQTKVAKIEEVDDDVMEAFIKWLYLGEADFNEFAEKLFVFADRYQVVDLKNQCIQFMIDDFYTENICKYLTLVLDYNEEKLRTAANEFASEMENEEINELLVSEEWVEFATKHEEAAKELERTMTKRAKMQ